MWNIMWNKTLDYQNDDFSIFPKITTAIKWARVEWSTLAVVNFVTQEFNVNYKAMRQSLNKRVNLQRASSPVRLVPPSISSSFLPSLSCEFRAWCHLARSAHGGWRPNPSPYARSTLPVPVTSALYSMSLFYTTCDSHIIEFMVHSHSPTPKPGCLIDIHIDKMCVEPNGNLHCSPFLSSMNTSTQFYESHFISVSVFVSVSGSVNTPLVSCWH